jgi:hypothetical protein
MLDDVPEFPEFRPLAMADRGLLERGFPGLGRECSEFTFACFYLFRCSAEPALSRLGETLLVRERCRGRGWCLLPPMLTDRPAEAAEEVFRAAAARPEAGLPRHMYGVTERLWRSAFEPGGRFQRRADRDNYDYVYERAALAELRGNRYHSKKNLINNFTRRHGWEYRKLAPELVEPARDLAERWCREKCGPADSLSSLEVAALKEGLGIAGELGLVAGVILVDGRVEALAMGEQLSADTAAVHFEKAAPGMKGLAQLMAREFAAREFTDCRYFNREQDLGDPGLRKAKESYYPVRLIEKYEVALAGDSAADQHFAYAAEGAEGTPP